MIPNGLGVGIPHQTLGAGLSLAETLRSLRPEWYYNWISDLRCPGYYPMLWRPVVGDAQWLDLAEYVKATGAPHFLYNEPEWQAQSNTAPAVAKDAVIAWRNAARVQKDGQWVYPTWMGPGVLVSHQKAYDWLDEFINLAPSSALPQVWAIHIYASNAQDWIDQWGRWKAWMWANHDAKRTVRKTVVSETASWTDSLSAQQAVLDAALDTLANDGLLQAVAWFSAAYGWTQGTWKKSDLLASQIVSESPTVLSATAPRTVMGDRFRQRSLEIALS